MKNVLLLINEPFESLSPNAICMEKVLGALHEYDVCTDVICLGANDEVKELDSKTLVYYVENRFIYTKNVFRKIIRKMYSVFVCPDINMLCRRKYERKIAQLNAKKRYDLLLASSGGFFSQIAALTVKRKIGLRTVSIFLDPPVSLNFLYKKNYPHYRRMIRYESEIFEKNEYIFMEENLYDEYASQSKHMDRIVKVGIPLVVERTEKIREQNCEKKRIVFMGTLWSDIRNPKYIIEQLECFKNLEVQFWGNTQTYLVLKELGYERLYCGFADQREVENIIVASDYLLNISNDNIVQTPSKIFEYISYGKPIINVIKNENDKTMKLINRYGNGVNIMEGSKRMTELSAFLEKKIEQVPSARIMELFNEYTPQALSKKLYDIM